MIADARPYGTALTIAGSDSGGGAGIQADLKTFADHGVFGMSVVTAVTAQNSRGVTRVDLVPVEGVRAQIRAIRDDFRVDVIKLGMLATAELAAAVADELLHWPDVPPIVVDPVMVATTGARLLTPDAIAVYRDTLLKLATVATPNVGEAAVLQEHTLDRDWLARIGRPLLITGGDGHGEVVDVLHYPGGRTREWRNPRLGGGTSFHGTGCTLASAIAARLTRGEALEPAISGGIAYVRRLIEASVLRGSPGKGHPVLPHGMTGPA